VKHSKRLDACAALFFGLSVCISGTSIAASSQGPAATKEETDSYVTVALVNAIGQTPYSALVVHTRVDIVPLQAGGRSSAESAEYVEERTIYHARVLETFRGKSVRQIRYEMVGERGEAAVIDSKPQILTLCSGPRGFYWPGTGASFPADQKLLVLARQVGREMAQGAPRSFAQCN